MLKISQAEAANEITILKLEGRVVGPWVAEVSRACEGFLSEGRAVQLDLADVSFVDVAGTTAMSSLKSRGVALENCSPFVAEQLKSLK